MSGVSMRSVVFALVLGCLVSCSQPVVPLVAGPAAPSPVEPAPEASGAREPPRFAPRVTEPKDARGIEPCDLLTSAQVDELGLDVATARPRDLTTARECTWTYTSGRNTGGLQVAVERTIAALDGVFVQRAGFAVFEPVTVAGYPGFRADRTNGDGCTLYVAIADYQLLAAGANVRGEPLPDPCAPSRRMAEMVLSNLPPLAS